MNPIHFLRFIKPVKTNIDGHFIYKIKTNFLVFTSQPIKGIDCIKISETNIKGENKPQYVADIVHKYDPVIHILMLIKKVVLFYRAKIEVNFRFYGII